MKKRFILELLIVGLAIIFIIFPILITVLTTQL
uniref:PBP-dependent ABC transporter-like protein n=1 Tax=Siphoviridae sp. ctCIv11 TaxID=2827806 RepID=A0A8S5S2E0_9CAUD|nr:MAG TPA: PBP-dependent ABC transporter-like protein [Siphoviridae sp. ctCIv11]